MCGEHNSLSFRLRFEHDDEAKVYSSFQSFPELQGYAGQMHGGIISALLDSAMTHCLFHRNVEGVTAELTVKYLKPVPQEADLRLCAWVEQKILTLYKLKAELSVAGEVLVKAESKFMEIRKQ